VPHLSNEYWDSVIDQFLDEGGVELWRAYSDCLNHSVFRQWLPETRPEKILKTDLFDEAIGTGLSRTLNDHCSLLAGIDISFTTTQTANRNHEKILAVQADVLHLPFPDDCFDVIVSNSTLDHFTFKHQIGEGIKELHRILKPGGQLLISLDNLSNPIIALRQILPYDLLRKLGIVPYYVGRTLTLNTLCNCMEHHNLIVQDKKTFMHSPRIFGIAAAKWIEKRNTEVFRKPFLKLANAFEVLAFLPTNLFTGYYIAIKAVKHT